MKDLSTISRFECIFEHLYWAFVLCWLYKNHVFVRLNEHSDSESMVILIFLVAIVSVVGCAIRWGKCMSSKGVLADIVCGIGIYTVMTYREYYPIWTSAVLILFCGLVIVFMFLIIKDGRKHNCSLNAIKSKKARLKYKFIQTLNIVGIVLGIFMTILVLPIAYKNIVKGENIAVNFNYGDMQGYDNCYFENEFSLASNIDSISKIRFESTWSNLSTQEKLKVLQDILNCELNFWGLEFDVEVVTEELSRNTLGCYCNKEKKITIDKSHLENSDPDQVLKTLLHESYHVWEYELVRLYIDSSVEQRKMRIFRNCEEYFYEMMNYQDGGNNYEEYMLYSCQCMERDSRAYASENVKIYYEEIDEILGTQGEDIH